MAGGEDEGWVGIWGFTVAGVVLWRRRGEMAEARCTAL